MRGAFLRRAFDGMRPLERPWVDWSRLYAGLDSPEFLERHRRLEAWYGAEKDRPGGMYLQAVKELFHENRLIRGDLVVLGQRVDLSAVHCPLALIAGARDHITPPAQVWAAEAVMSCTRVLRHTVDAGHVGVFIGRTALVEDWPPILKWLQTADKGPVQE
jgi:poly(3-hydroxyalkanoate) synthetase